MSGAPVAAWLYRIEVPTVADLSTLSANVAIMQRYVQTYLDVLAKGPLSAQQAAALHSDLQTLAVDLERLHAAMAPAATTPMSGATVPASGLTQWSAAGIDAGFVFRASLGDTVGADTNPAPGAAAALGFSGVVGTSTPTGALYAIFRDGRLTATATEPPATGWGFPFGLSNGHADDPYTGPGAVRP